jgi:hypothetical protein
MADIKIANWIEDASEIFYNPTLIQRLSLQRLRDIKDGLVDIPDATSPFAFALENSAVNTSAFIEADFIASRRQYASLAQTEEDLYLHMSDKDYVDRFATPAHCNFFVMIRENALQRAMVFDQTTSVSRVVIPRNTEFSVGDLTFSIQYPIEIKRIGSGSYQITYITDKPSPLSVLKTNIVEFDRVQVQRGIWFIRLKIPTEQFWIKSTTSAISSAKMFRKTIAFEDNFYYARVFYKNNTTANEWKEIRTTHTDQVYDPLIPTAVLQVKNNELNVHIPQIYFSNESISGNIRIDVYQTKGEISISLPKYLPESFTAKWRAIDNVDMTPEVSRFIGINEIVIYSTDIVNDGTNALEFAELRSRVINNTTGARDNPITDIQLEDSLKSNGFTVVKNVDVVTDRTFLATRDLIKPFDERLITSAATSMQSLIATMGEISKHPAVFKNGDCITLTPDIIYRIRNGQMELVSANRISQILSMSGDELAKAINSETLVYSPFHYVLDATKSSFEVRPYFMDNPQADIRQFIDNNDSTLLEANTSLYSINRTNFGYRLVVNVVGNDAYKSLSNDRKFAQLYYRPKNEVSNAYIQGEFLGERDDGSLIYQFDLYTTFDIDDKHQLAFNSFSMANMITQPHNTDLLQEFRIIYGTYDINAATWVAHAIDGHVGQFMLDEHGYAITEESFSLEFGVHLANLWNAARSFPGPKNYKRYEVDIPALYPEDVFLKDPVTGAIFSLDEDNNVTYEIIHRKGDFVFLDDGSQLFDHRAGDVIKDPVTGEPEITSPMEVNRQLDLMVIEGPYYFATDPSSRDYKEAFIAALVDWITVDMPRLQGQVLDKTKIFYYPKSNMGSMQVLGDNGLLTFMQASQSFDVKLSVKEKIIKDSSLRDSMTRDVIRAIDRELKKSTVSDSNIISDLRKIMNEDDVPGIKVSGFGSAKMGTVSMVSLGDRFSIRKRLTAQSDGKLIVEEDINVEFIQHGDN